MPFRKGIILDVKLRRAWKNNHDCSSREVSFVLFSFKFQLLSVSSNLKLKQVCVFFLVSIQVISFLAL